MMKNEQHNAAHIRAMAAGLRDGMGGHADACAELMEQLAKGVSAAEQAQRKTVTLEELVAELKADTHGDAISAAMDQAVADMALGRAMRSAKRAEPRCACGDGFTEDAMCANCIAAAEQPQQAEPVARDVLMALAEEVHAATKVAANAHHGGAFPYVTFDIVDLSSIVERYAAQLPAVGVPDGCELVRIKQPRQP